MSVCPSMHSNCGHFRPEPITYSESVSPEGLSLAIHFPEMWPNYRRKGYATNAFLRENFVL